MKRVFLFVLDSCGCGEMPDAASFGDYGVNTLKSCSTSDKLHIPNMLACGLGNIQKVRDGDPLGGRTNASAEFDTLDDEDFLS